MRQKAGVIFAAVLYYSGLVGLARRLMQWRGPHLIILNYHRASDGVLLQHLLYLRRYYRLLPLQQALEELYQPAPDQQQRDRRTPVVITFDDGYADMYTHAFVLARRLHIPITIFLIPGYLTGKQGNRIKTARTGHNPKQTGKRTGKQVVKQAIGQANEQAHGPANGEASELLAEPMDGQTDEQMNGKRDELQTEPMYGRANERADGPAKGEANEPLIEQNGNRRFWWHEGKHLAASTRVEQVTLDGYTYQLDQPAERELLSNAIDNHLRQAHSVAEREEWLTRVRRLLSVPADQAGRWSLSWEEVVEMQQSGLISFGAHTLHHPVLAHLSDPAEVRSEVVVCRHVLEQALQCPVSTFAYPIGKAEHIGDVALQAVKEAGYRWAVTTQPGINTPGSDPYRLKRIPGDVSRHPLIMAAEVSGIWSMLSPLWKKLIFQEYPDNTD